MQHSKFPSVLPSTVLQVLFLFHFCNVKTTTDTDFLTWFNEQDLMNYSTGIHLETHSLTMYAHILTYVFLLVYFKFLGGTLKLYSFTLSSHLYKILKNFQLKCLHTFWVYTNDWAWRYLKATKWLKTTFFKIFKYHLAKFGKFGN